MLWFMFQKLLQNLEASLNNFLKFFRFSFLLPSSILNLSFSRIEQISHTPNKNLKGISLCNLLINLWHLIYEVGYIVDPGNSEELSEEFEGANVLESEEIVEGVDELFAFGVEDLVEYFFVIVSDYLSKGRNSRIRKTRSRCRRGRGKECTSGCNPADT